MEATIFTVDDLTAATNNFARERLVGEGGSGEVFRGVLPGTGQRVAVKRWRGGASPHGLSELMNEVTVLSRVAHVNVLPVLGYSCQPPVLMLVTPYMARGSLHDALHGSGVGGTRPGVAWRVGVVAGIARGIRALREAQIVHRDVKSANVLISDDADGHPTIAKLADAGVARHMRELDAAQTHAATSTRVIGTDGYLDPEYQDTEQLTYKSDVFSFGVVLLEAGPRRCPVQILLLPCPATSSTRSVNPRFWSCKIIHMTWRVTSATRALPGGADRAPGARARREAVALSLAAASEPGAGRPRRARRDAGGGGRGVLAGGAGDGAPRRRCHGRAACQILLATSSNAL